MYYSCCIGNCSSSQFLLPSLELTVRLIITSSSAMCAITANRVIEGDVVSALNKAWCVSCFSCSTCNTKLTLKDKFRDAKERKKRPAVCV
ncbi:hypothetical protein KUCAC02_001919 [Chaenocephalus aceratus]|uniref:Uncharacterized protein n=1 Tax=Chaenocephalus aceratus TaxID=36190 RepID=A0ACB9XS10_CHAAC|nr:hypothetical protein KUCAC02_001919 [Chaenocephalus aceratus]